MGIARVGVVLAATALAAAATQHGAQAARPDAPVVRPPQLANHCLAIASVANRRYVVVGDGGYRAAGRRRPAERFFLKPTGLRRYLLHDRRGALLARGADGSVTRARVPGEAAEWALPRRAGRTVAIRADGGAGELTVGRAGALRMAAARTAGRAQRFRLIRRRGCTAFPEARLGARGRPRRSANRDGTVFGFADLHLHITADLRAGGRVVHGRAFDRFGVARALGGDEEDHGPDGSLDVTGNLLRDGSPAGTHDTQGWPGFGGWPVHDTYTHQQSYYMWVKRVWRSGLRLAVAQTIEDEPLCRLEPLRSHSCDEMETVELQIERLRRLQDYVDAQSGGRGRGWFRLVYSPRQARRVIRRGKLAVVIGMETSNPLGCSQFMGVPRCTRADIDSRLDELHRLGVRSMFVAHWVDNALAGAALQPSPTGDFIAAMQLSYTGRPFATEPCTGGDEAEGTCNSAGLTALGEHAIRRMIERGMLIEVDHLSQRAKAAVLAIAASREYPVVTSHTDTGGEWTPDQLALLYRLGGLPAATPDTSPGLSRNILRLGDRHGGEAPYGVALGTDTGGLAALPGPRADSGDAPLSYPFRSADGHVRFGRQRTGRRTFDLNSDGVAHYGLVADLLADARRRPEGRHAMRPLLRSAEGYLRMWRRAAGPRRQSRPRR